MTTALRIVLGLGAIAATWTWSVGQMKKQEQLQKDIKEFYERNSEIEKKLREFFK